jgi:2-polyprenyl-6-methoxyphenol hydroxylase-like FAD-dependent oxidoreductase
MGTVPVESKSAVAGQKVIVVGAGPAGLALAVSLGNIWKDDHGLFPDVTIYEREKSQRASNREGYSVSIRSGELAPGIQALQGMGILNDTMNRSIIREGNERSFCGLWSRDWRRLATKRKSIPKGLPISGMRIKRTELQTVLITAALNHARIVWGTACTELLPASSGSIRLRLSDGTEDSCDLLVVADGANSKLRASIRPRDLLRFAKVVTINGVSCFSGPPPEPIARDWGIVASGRGVALFVSPMDQNNANWSLSYRASECRQEQRRPISEEAADGLLQEAEQRGYCFNEPFPTLLKHTNKATLSVLNTMDKQPFVHDTDSGIPEGVVFIGDSNHAVTPFAGNGANMALADGFDLAEHLCNHRSVADAVAAYDKLSMLRASRSVRRSYVSIHVVHSSGISWILYRSLLLVYSGILSMWYRTCDTLQACNRQWFSESTSGNLKINM